MLTLTAIELIGGIVALAAGGAVGYGWVSGAEFLLRRSGKVIKTAKAVGDAAPHSAEMETNPKPMTDAITGAQQDL